MKTVIALFAACFALSNVALANQHGGTEVAKKGKKAHASKKHEEKKAEHNEAPAGEAPAPTN